jgi:hypothetical protein
VAVFGSHRIRHAVIRLASATATALMMLSTDPAYGSAAPSIPELADGPDSNSSPSPPVLLAPSDSATLHRFGNAPFSISSVDPDNDIVTGTIVIQDSEGAEIFRFLTSPAASGGISFGVLARPLAEGTYTWTAFATDVFGASSGPSANRSFSVAPPPTAGGGALHGEVDFSAPGIPPSTGVCEPSASTFDLESTAAVFNSAIVGFVGPAGLSGSGLSDCESALFGEGIATFDIRGTGPTGSTVLCSDLSGPFTRVETALVLRLIGGCEINDQPISRVTVAISLLLAPGGSDGGITTRVPDADVAGGFVVMPA